MIWILVALLVVGLGLAGLSLLTFDPAPLTAGQESTPAAAAQSPRASTPPTPTPEDTASPTASGTAAPPAEIAGIKALDPQGDGDENGSSAPRAIDGDEGTAWRSERYGTPEFGGIKKGLGLLLDLGDPSTVTEVTLQAPGEDGTVELRNAPGPGFSGSKVVAEAAISGGRVVLAPSKPLTTPYLIVWFTRVPQAQQGERRIYVSEITVR